MSEPDKLERGISVILCTHNGVANLPQTLRHLAGQQMPYDLPWEVIFVDNASTDDSTTLVQQEWAVLGHPAKLVCLQEAQPGKYFALQTAIANVQYDYFVVCDDDNWLAPNYLHSVVDILDSHPEVGAVGGRGIPVTENGQPLPDWFDDYQEGYAVGPQGKHRGDVTYTGHLWGAGLGSRTALHRVMYAKYPSFLLLHENPDVLCAEDSEYCLRLVLRGYRLFYEDKLLYQHAIPNPKLTKDHITRLYGKYRESYAVIGKYLMTIALYDHGKIRWVRWLHYALRAIWSQTFARNRKQQVKAKTRMTYLFSSKRKPDELGKKIRAFMADQSLPRYR